MAVFEAYRSEENKDIETVIVDETSGDLCKAFLSVGKYEKKKKSSKISKVVIRNCESKTDRQYNCQDKKDKTTTHDLQNTTQKTKN